MWLVSFSLPVSCIKSPPPFLQSFNRGIIHNSRLSGSSPSYLNVTPSNICGGGGDTRHSGQHRRIAKNLTFIIFFTSNRNRYNCWPGELLNSSILWKQQKKQSFAAPRNILGMLHIYRACICSGRGERSLDYELPRSKTELWIFKKQEGGDSADLEMKSGGRAEATVPWGAKTCLSLTAVSANERLAH